MTGKRFIPIFDGYDKRVVGAKDNGKIISFMDMFDLLNEQHETIQQLQKDNKILMDKMFVMRTNNAFDRTEISNQYYTVDEFLEELEKW